MTIKRKIEKIIEKGGDVNSDKEKKEWINFTIRIRTDMLEEVQKAVDETIGISKTGWILQAIQEKLKKN